MSNLSNWEKLARPPVTALKPILAGRLKGKSDINPQWRYKAMTEVYGPCGEGWKYSIDRLWTEPGAQDQVMAFAQVSLFVCKSNVWSDPIPGVGGSMLIAKESSGLHTSDEAFKMAITDALSVALKMLGVAADIYMGAWDGSKYKTEAANDAKTAAGKTNGNFKPAVNVVGQTPYRMKDGCEAKPDRIEYVVGVAQKVLGWVNQKRLADAVLEYDNATLEIEERQFVWTFLDSTQRRAIKDEDEAQRKKYAESQLGQQA